MKTLTWNTISARREINRNLDEACSMHTAALKYWNRAIDEGMCALLIECAEKYITRFEDEIERLQHLLAQEDAA